MISFNYKVKVYYKDVDQMGVVYYTRYLEYFEAARTELLKSIGMSVTHIEENGYYLPVVTVYCEYKSGANFEDRLIVKSSINEMPKARLKIHYQVLRQGDLIVKGYTIHAFTDLNSKPKRPPKLFIDTLVPYFQ